MQRELYEVEKDRFDLKDSSLYHLQGTWPKDHKPEAVLDGEKLPAAISAQERVSALERFKDLDLVNGERVQMEICLPDLEGKKKLVIVALEIVRDGVGRAYAQVIDDASASSFRPFFDRYISKDAKVITDEWSGYLPLKKDYPKLEQRPSDKGKGHPQIHIHIMNIKGWLRGIHHHCSKEHLQGYLDEYHFRFNRRNNMDTIFDMLLRRMICQKKTD